jgi:hypothetical protein
LGTEPRWRRRGKLCLRDLDNSRDRLAAADPL